MVEMKKKTKKSKVAVVKATVQKDTEDAPVKVVKKEVQ